MTYRWNAVNAVFGAILHRAVSGWNINVKIMDPPEIGFSRRFQALMDEGYCMLCQLHISFSLNGDTNRRVQESKADLFWGYVHILCLVALLAGRAHRTLAFACMHSEPKKYMFFGKTTVETLLGLPPSFLLDTEAPLNDAKTVCSCCEVPGWSI